MPAPRESGPHNRPRRRPEPMPGGWLWIIVLLLFAGIIWVLLGVTSAGTIRYSDFIDLAKRNRSVLDLLYGNDTFVNRALAKHYGMPEPIDSPAARPKDGSDGDWVHVEDANRFGRGGFGLLLRGFRLALCTRGHQKHAGRDYQHPPKALIVGHHSY